MGEREADQFACCGAEEAKAVKNRLIWMACVPLRARVMSEPGCCQGPCLGPWSYHSQDLC